MVNNTVNYVNNTNSFCWNVELVNGEMATGVIAVRRSVITLRGRARRGSSRRAAQLGGVKQAPTHWPTLASP